MEGFEPPTPGLVAGTLTDLSYITLTTTSACRYCEHPKLVAVRETALVASVVLRNAVVTLSPRIERVAFEPKLLT